jgi:predicted flap endonuclease-1-like 5' DNA nuclease
MRMTDESAALPDGLAAPARRALDACGITRLDQLAGMSEKELRSLHGMGAKAVGQLREALEAQGLSFADD